MKRCLIHSETETPKSVSSSVRQHPRKFVRIPLTVMYDESITSDDRDLFGHLSAKTYKNNAIRCNTVMFTLRDLAEILRVGAQTVSRRLGRLEAAGHIKKLSKNREKSVYRLISPVFDYKVHVESGKDAVAETTSTELPILRDKKRRCPKCKALSRIVSTSGVCDSCVREWAERLA